MLLTQRYFEYLDNFVEQYAAPFRVFALRPTIDRSLVYQLHIQDYALSCEITALRIILDRLGIMVSERDIFASIPQFPYAYSTGGIWGDPEIEFVGYYTGGQAKQTGYGVYEAPIAEYAQSYSLRTRIINQSSYSPSYSRTTHIGELLSTLDDPHSHVILWGDWCTDPTIEDGFFPK
jgi:Peptidase_C39 like family